MRVAANLGFEQIDELCVPVSDYEVVGPTGQYYGRYKTYPKPSQIPLYTMVKEIKPSAATIKFGPGGPVVVPGAVPRLDGLGCCCSGVGPLTQKKLARMAVKSRY